MSHLKFLENPDKSEWGTITDLEQDGVEYAVDLAKTHTGPIVEVGILFGHTTSLLASLKNPEKSLIGIDNFSWNPFLPQASHRDFTFRSMRYVIDHCNTEIFDGEAADFYRRNPSLNPSMVFIDAKHDYESVKQDIAWAKASSCPVIAGHDYSSDFPGVL